MLLRMETKWAVGSRFCLNTWCRRLPPTCTRRTLDYERRHVSIHTPQTNAVHTSSYNTRHATSLPDVCVQTSSRSLSGRLFPFLAVQGSRLEPDGSQTCYTLKEGASCCPCVPQARWSRRAYDVSINRSLGSAGARFGPPNMANEPRNSCVNSQLGSGLHSALFETRSARVIIKEH